MSRGCLRRLRNGPSRPAIYDALKTHSHRECWRQPGMAFPWRMSPGRPQISPPRGEQTCWYMILASGMPRLSGKQDCRIPARRPAEIEISSFSGLTVRFKMIPANGANSVIICPATI
jgi:hypothetical protein